jgi:ubiquinone/menaquinone biosynthesis C-methylase UbiE
VSFYDAVAKGYDELYGEEQRRKYKIGLKKLKPSYKVLDVGCGTALLFLELPKGTYYLGIDVSPGMLEVAKERVKNSLADLVLATAEALPLRSKSFPTCYSFTVLQNVEDPERALEEVRRVCAKAVVSSLKGKGLRGEGCEEVYPDVICSIV